MNTKRDDRERRDAAREQATNMFNDAMRILALEGDSIVSEIQHSIETVAPRIIRARLLRVMRPHDGRPDMN